VVGSAEDGCSGIVLVRERQPHVVLVDVLMPDMDGVAATAIIFKEMPATQINGLSSTMEARLVGLFSSHDALAGRPLAELLDDLAMPDGVKDALLGRSSQMGYVYQLVRAYESGDWIGVSDRARTLGMDENILPAIYSRSVEYVGQVAGTSSWGKP
jgi:c-di-GMP-related signal transduction protein